MNTTLKVTFVASLLAASFTASAIDTPNWGNPYDLYVGGVSYHNNNGSHQGNHGSTVTGPSFMVCNQRLNEAMAYHSSAGDSFVGQTMCHLSTTVLYLPQIVAPDNGGNTGPDHPLFEELSLLEKKYNIDAYQDRLNQVQQEFNIEGFRAEYEQLHVKSLQITKRK